MKRIGLVSPVRVAGSSFLGFDAICHIRNCAASGLHLVLPDNTVVAVTDMVLGVNQTLHYLTLTHGRFTLRLPEHLLGMIYALGMDGVRIELSPHFCIPYNGGAECFWRAVRPALREKGEFGWVTPTHSLEAVGPNGRHLSFEPAVGGVRSLSCQIRVAYPELGEFTLNVVLGTGPDYENVFRARPYLRSRAHRLVARAAEFLGWPHSLGRFAWPTEKTPEAKKAVLVELAWHRLLDMLGAFVVYCPPGKRFAGLIKSDMCGHAVDVQLLYRLKDVPLRLV